jgi:hypothetical protein
MEETVDFDSDVVVTKDVLDAAVTAAYALAGMSKVNKDGITVPDGDELKERVYQAVSSHVVNNRTEMSRKEKTLTQGELYASVFPGAPGTDPRPNAPDLSPLEDAVRDKLRRACWNMTNPNRKGSVQTRLGKEGRSEVVIRTKLPRGVDEIIGVFVTDDADIIMKESVNPMVEKLLAAAKELRLHNELVVEARHSELAPQITKLLDVARRRVNAELARTASNGSAPALPAGSPSVAASE